MRYQPPRSTVEHDPLRLRPFAEVAAEYQRRTGERLHLASVARICAKAEAKVRAALREDPAVREVLES